MKKLVLSSVVILLGIFINAQAPQKMSYQAVIRNSSGALVTNQAVGIRISILQGSATGSVVFSETYSPNPQTNANGLVTVEIGSGSTITGTFTVINWATGPYFLKTETDPTGGSNYTIVGTSQLLSVPYALHAINASTADYNTLTNLPALNIANWNTSFGWGNHSGLYRLNSWIPAWTDVTGKPTFATVATSGSYNDLSNKPIILNSQWSTNGSNIYYNDGNVGIGLNNPAGMLEIYGNSIDNYPQLLLSETDGYARVSFKTMPASSKHWVLAGHTNQTDGDSQWHLNYFNGTVGKNIFSVYGNSNISFDGKVGIGITVPGSLLQVHSNTTYANTVTPIIKISDNYKTWNIGLGDPGDRFSISSEDNKDRLTILKSNGYIGLGTTSPSAGLHIKANSWPGSFIYLESNSGSDAGIRFYESTTPKWHIYNNAAAGGLQITNFAAQTAIFVKQSNSFVGIGTSNPDYILDVAGGINIIKGLSGSALLCNGSQAIWYNGTYFSWGYEGTHNYFANKVTIGNASNPAYMLYVQGSAYTTGTWSSSDLRFKKDISTIDNALDQLMKVRGASFLFRTDEFMDYQFAEGIQYGFIAQEVEKVFPGLVHNESDGFKSLNYNGMMPILLESIKEQQLEIESQQKQIDELKHLVNNLLQK